MTNIISRVIISGKSKSKNLIVIYDQSQVGN